MGNTPHRPSFPRARHPWCVLLKISYSPHCIWLPTNNGLNSVKNPFGELVFFIKNGLWTLLCVCVCVNMYTRTERPCVEARFTPAQKTITACPTRITILEQSVPRSVFALTLGTGSCRRRRVLTGAPLTRMGLCLPKSPVLPKPRDPTWAASQAIPLIPPVAPGAASCLPRVPPPLPTKGFSKAWPHAPAHQESVHVFLRRRKIRILNSRFSVCPQFHPQIMM